MRRPKFLPVILALTLCLTTLPVTAFAGGGPEDGSDKVLEYWSQDSTPPQDAQQPEEPPAVQQQKPQQGEALSQGSEFSTRDLLYDKDTHKQFITVEGRNGNIFYLVIDYDAPVNEGEEQYKTYFLNQVDEADLSALLEQGEPAACSCTEKCHAGAVNTACPLCAVNMAECVGKEPEPEPDPAPTESPEPKPEKKDSTGGLLVILLAVAAAGGGAVYFWKLKKKKPDVKGSDDLDEYDYGDDEDEPEDGEPDGEDE